MELARLGLVRCKQQAARTDERGGGAGMEPHCGDDGSALRPEQNPQLDQFSLLFLFVRQTCALLGRVGMQLWGGRAGSATCKAPPEPARGGTLQRREQGSAPREMLLTRR